jgi:hypothetical protein
LDPNQARYQTSPHPDSQAIIMKLCPFVKPLAAFLQDMFPAVGIGYRGGIL